MKKKATISILATLVVCILIGTHITGYLPVKALLSTEAPKGAEELSPVDYSDIFKDILSSLHIEDLKYNIYKTNETGQSVLHEYMKSIAEKGYEQKYTYYNSIFDAKIFGNFFLKGITGICIFIIDTANGTYVFYGTGLATYFSEFVNVGPKIN